MERIIMDSYVKQDKQIYGEDRDLAFNKRVLAINAMYGWLNEQGILEKIAFAYQDCPEDIHFVLDARDLEPYRKTMEESKVPEAALAVQHLLDEPYTPCVYSGAIQPGWLMNTYREMDGVVGRSWECGLVQFLNAGAVSEVSRVRAVAGVKAAVQKVFSYYQWPEMTEEKGRDALTEAQDREQGVWISIYKDALGMVDEQDNLTEICVPKNWRMEILEAEGVDTDIWFDTYTADDTETIAQRALVEGIILDCSEKNITLKNTSFEEKKTLKPGAVKSVIQNAESSVKSTDIQTVETVVDRETER